MALKSGEERLKEMEAEMALFEQEVLGGPVQVSGSPPVMEAVPVALAVPAVPVVRPIIGTNTYRQVQQTLEARAASFVGPPPPAFVGPVPPVRPPPPPMMRPAFVPHILQRPGSTHCPRLVQIKGGQRLPMMRGPSMAPPLPRPPPPPPMMLPPSLQGQTPQGASQPIQHMSAAPQVGGMVSMVSAPNTRQGALPPVKPSQSIIQAAPTVYSAPPAPVGHKRVDVRAQRQARMEELAARVAEQQAAVMAAGLLDKKESDDSSAVIGPSMPEPEPPHTEPVESASEDKKKARVEKVKKCIRTAAGISWEDPSLLEWESDDFRIFCGDLGNEVNDDILARAFSRYPSFLKAKVVRDKRTGKTKGYGFVSFKDPNDYVRAMREMNGKYVGSRPIKLRKSMWKDRNMEVVRKKQKEKKKLGLR
ncbi:RNA-binding protein 42 isoform X2 [Trachinotus anak]|uniref:RNA-binding protein 42 isoform X2 n=1 Tax=Trachinotus anak TaxID=443729 RepID=UPI0039F19418